MIILIMLTSVNNASVSVYILEYFHPIFSPMLFIIMQLFFNIKSLLKVLEQLF